jgi:hypothetical protein
MVLSFRWLLIIQDFVNWCIRIEMVFWCFYFYCRRIIIHTLHTHNYKINFAYGSLKPIHLFSFEFLKPFNRLMIWLPKRVSFAIGQIFAIIYLLTHTLKQSKSGSSRPSVFCMIMIKPVPNIDRVKYWLYSCFIRFQPGHFHSFICVIA